MSLARAIPLFVLEKAGGWALNSLLALLDCVQMNPAKARVP